MAGIVPHSPARGAATLARVARGVHARLKELLDPGIEAEAEKSWELYACKFDDDSDKNEPIANPAVALPISREAKEVRC